MWYPAALKKFLDGSATINSATMVQLLNASYTFDSTDVFLSDIPGGDRLGDPASTVLTYDGVVQAAQAAVSGVALGETVTQYVIYQDTGVEGTSPLFLHEDRSNDGTPLLLNGNGSVILIDWPNGLGSI